VSGEVGNRIRSIRTQREIAQAKLASDVGVSGSYLSLIEAGRRPATRDVLQRIAMRLGCSMEFLETGHGATDDRSLELDLKFAELALRAGDPAEAGIRFAEVFSAAEGRGWGDMALDARWGMGRAREAQGLIEDAIDDYESLFKHASLPASISRLKVATALSRAYNECGDLDRAIEVGESAISAADAGESDEEAVGLVSTLVGSYYERGDLTRAHSLAMSALATADSADAPLARAAALWNASLVEEARGDLRMARTYADRALAIYSESDNARAVALLRIVAAWLMLREPEPSIDEAEGLLQRALNDLETVGSPIDAAYGETELARCRLLVGDWQEAAGIAEASLAHLGGTSPIEAARARLVLGHALLMGGDSDGAVSAYTEASRDLKTFGAHRMAAAAWRELAEALARLGRSEEALDAYRQASDAAGVSRSPEQQVATSHAALRRT
jgi:transcriptional regulator with XRE-family HTH domain